MTDAELVRQTRQGQSSAFEALVRRWSARLIGYVRAKVKQPEIAEDIAQETFLKAYRSMDSLAEPSKFGSWLLSIAHRASLDWLKAKARGELRFGDMNEGLPNAHSGDWQSAEQQPADLCIRKEQENSVIGQIDALPEVLREVLMMYYYDDVTYKELAEILEVSTATVNARLTKARHLLREQLSDLRRWP